MKKTYACVFICIVALVIIEQENNILSRVSDRLIQKQTPWMTPAMPLDNSTTTQNGILTMLFKFTGYEQEEDEVDNLSKYTYNGQKHILIMALRRTGSSFVGQFFNQHEKIFYLYEPLYHVELGLNLRMEEFAGIYPDVLHGLFLCNFSLLEQFISPPPEGHVTTMFFRRESSLALCKEPVCTPVIEGVSERFPCLNQHCGPLNLTLASESCLSKQHRVMKTVRFQPLDTLEPLVRDPRLDVRVIHLVRDPRAIIASRIVAFPSVYREWQNWVKGSTMTEDDEEVKTLKHMCDQIRMSAELGLSQPSWLRRRYMLVRYEDITRYPMLMAENMYRFSGIPFSHNVREWILGNTQITPKNSNAFSTQRNSSEQADKWRFKIPLALAQLVQRVCEPNMKLFGYRFVDDEKTLTNKSISLLEEGWF